ncbi:hypothetical protein ONZ45_g118 [Pleurotus djamor]|nr:hypothetical protein ONZ45_g118 [Pleurotus djamor]
MNFLFTPNHVQLLNACYPPSSVLLSSGPDFTPKGSELSRLTYYAYGTLYYAAQPLLKIVNRSNHPSKVNKLALELEKRLKVECKKAQQGNTRTRVSLLISLSIFRSLAIECRRDIHLISPPLISSINATLNALPTDLEVVARAASVFTAWTTYTDGQQIGADSQLTKDYLSILRSFADLSCSDYRDHEIRNRQVNLRALSSEALYNDLVQFRAQVSVIMKPLLLSITGTDITSLDNQELPMSPYLAEFRRRPAIERRAASIHVHVDGEKGPSNSDVLVASLHALFLLLSHANGLQLAYIMRSSLDTLDTLNVWSQVDHCAWYANKAVEWAQYQYRYAVPSCIVERLLETQDAVVTASYSTLANVLSLIFKSPIPLINLSTSDINSNLVTILIRRTNANPSDSLLPLLVQCISSLGCHVYYSDQIHDLAGELINRIMIVESRPISSVAANNQSRSQSIRCLLASLLGLIHSSNEHEILREANEKRKGHGSILGKASAALSDSHHSADDFGSEPSSRRTRIPPDMWLDTVSLLCDPDAAVRADYAEALVYYLTHEMPKENDLSDRDGVRHRLIENGLAKHQANGKALISAGDVSAKLLNAVHAFIYLLVTKGSSDQTSSNSSQSGGSQSPQPTTRQSNASAQGPRARKQSIVQRMLCHLPSRVTTSSGASMSDYAYALKVLMTIHHQHPARGLLTGIPMLVALDEASRPHDLSDQSLRLRVQIIRSIVSKGFLTIGQVWCCTELVNLVQQTLLSFPSVLEVPLLSSPEVPEVRPPLVPMPLPEYETPDNSIFPGIDVEAALLAIASNTAAQDATGLDEQGVIRVLTVSWTADAAIRNATDQSSAFDTVRGDVISPLIRISPAFTNIENVSLHSLARSTRGAVIYLNPGSHVFYLRGQ